MFKKMISISALVCANLISIAAFAAQTETAYTTYSRYDERGLLLGTISPKTASGYLATRNTYDDSGKLTYVERGSLKDWQDDTILPSAWVDFTLVSAQRTGYDTYGRKVKETVYDNAGKALSLVQMNYETDGNILCKAVRMNPAVYSSLPGACDLSTEGANGPDRISKFDYNFRDQLEVEERGLKTDKAQTYITNVYDGIYLQIQYDANKNKTELRYDSNARLERMVYPSKIKPVNGALGDVNESDYVKFTYDDNGNKLTERKRNGDTISYTYDANNRMVVKDYANNATINDVCHTYDNRGLQLEAHFSNSVTPSVCITGVGLSNTYDGRGNILTATTNQSGTARSIVYTYDLNGNRETIKHPDNVIFKYGFDGINRVTGVANNGNADNSLLAVNYGVSGKRSSITRNGSSGAITEFKFENGVNLNEFTQTLGTATNNLTNTFKYNAASQVIRLTESNTSYSYVGNDDRAGTYTPDGLNRYTSAPLPSMGVVPFGYDSNSNLTNDGSAVYTYDSENRLLTTAKSGKILTFQYDPNGRLYQYTTGDGVSHKYLYDNNSLVLEYINDVVDKRYVHGDQADEPWIVYNGASVSSANLSYLHTNHQGSIIAYSNASGAVTNKLAYDAYGIPASLNMGTFGYTGQVYLKELGLYYYKARIYHPQLGRFMQTDPIGYKDDMDLYSYVGNDPLNRTDPTGEFGIFGAALGGASSAAAAYISGQRGMDVVVAGATGFVVGAATGGVGAVVKLGAQLSAAGMGASAATAASVVTVSAASAAAGNALGQGVSMATDVASGKEARSFDGTQVAVAGAIGAVSSAFTAITAASEMGLSSSLTVPQFEAAASVSQLSATAETLLAIPTTAMDGILTDQFNEEKENDH